MNQKTPVLLQSLRFLKLVKKTKFVTKQSLIVLGQFSQPSKQSLIVLKALKQSMIVLRAVKTDPKQSMIVL